MDSIESSEFIGMHPNLMVGIAYKLHIVQNIPRTRNALELGRMSFKTKDSLVGPSDRGEFWAL